MIETWAENKAMLLQRNMEIVLISKHNIIGQDEEIKW